MILLEEKMNTKLYVGGLPYTTTESELEDLFAEHGQIQSVRIITDRMTGRFPRLWFCRNEHA